MVSTVGRLEAWHQIVPLQVVDQLLSDDSLTALAINVRLDTCRWFLNSTGSSEVFFNSGVMIAFFCDAGRSPSRGDALISAVKNGSNASTASFSRRVRIGSREQDLVGEFIMT